LAQWAGRPQAQRQFEGRPLDMVEGRSKQAFQTWLSERPQAWRDAIEVVAMDGFTGDPTNPARPPRPSW
jgi:transposase